MVQATLEEQMSNILMVLCHSIKKKSVFLHSVVWSLIISVLVTTMLQNHSWLYLEKWTES